MLKPAAKLDWFDTDQETIRPIAEAPGIKVVGDAFQIHRSHLPLLDTDDAMRALARWHGGTNKERDRSLIWACRDRLTEPLGFTLRRVQHTAVDFIRRRRGTLLGDDPRVGKTLSCAFSHEWPGKLVVIAPLMVREVWLGWLRRIFPGEDIGIMTGRLFDPIEAAKPIVFGHYDILYGWQDGTQIGTLILDEAHMLTNRNSRRSRAAVFLASRAERVIAATGTPIWNMPPDLWNVLGLVAPGAFGDYYSFGNRYGAPEVTAYGTRFTGLSNEAELSLRLSEVMLRRRWADVCDDLPPITRNTVIVDLDDRQRRKLDIAAESLRQGDRTNTAGALARYRDALSMTKLPATIAEAECCLNRGDSVVIWTWHRELADTITELLLADNRQAFKLTGDTPMKGRDQVLNQWREGPAALVATMSVAQVGIDLSHAHRAIFAEIDYTPAMIAQAEMRTFAPTRPMNVSYVIADHFVDRKIIAALHRKLEAATGLGVGSGEGAIAAIDAAFRTPEEIADMDRFMADLLS
jgi:superfamily II DNA or RNA helicase